MSGAQYLVFTDWDCTKPYITFTWTQLCLSPSKSVSLVRSFSLPGYLLGQQDSLITDYSSMTSSKRSKNQIQVVMDERWWVLTGLLPLVITYIGFVWLVRPCDMDWRSHVSQIIITGSYHSVAWSQSSVSAGLGGPITIHGRVLLSTIYSQYNLRCAQHRCASKGGISHRLQSRSWGSNCFNYQILLNKMHGEQSVLELKMGYIH